MFKEKKLKAIIIADEKTKEVYAVISNNENHILKKGFVIIEDYSKESDKALEYKNGTLYFIDNLEVNK